jgi:polar amino acid transport system permease protein
LFAIWRFMVPRWLSWPVTVYVEAIRNTPLLVQLYIIFLGLPSAGIRLSALEASMLGMTLNLGAYSTEIFRAGFNSIKHQQIEAGEALSLTRLQILRHVVLMPAVSRVWPSLIGQFILMMLGTSVCSFISLEELSGIAYNIQSETFLSFEVYLIIGVIYLCLTVVMKMFFAVLGTSLFSRNPSTASAGMMPGSNGALTP